jgi:hypothetical protein
MSKLTYPDILKEYNLFFSRAVFFQNKEAFEDEDGIFPL